MATGGMFHLLCFCCWDFMGITFSHIHTHTHAHETVHSVLSNVKLSSSYRQVCVGVFWLFLYFYIQETMDRALTGCGNVCCCQLGSHKMFFFSHFMSNVEWKFSQVLMLLYKLHGDVNFEWKLDRTYAVAWPVKWGGGMNHILTANSLCSSATLVHHNHCF